MTSSEKSAQPELGGSSDASVPGGSRAVHGRSSPDVASPKPAPASEDRARAPQHATGSAPAWWTAVLVLVAGLSAGAAAGYLLSPAPPIEETRFLNFDDESTPQGYLIGGFSGVEVTEEGDTFRWCESKVVRLKVQNRADGERTLRVRFWPFEYPDGPNQSVSLLVNERLVGKRDMKSGPQVASFRVPATFWRKGDNELRFAFKYAESPVVKAPPNQDKRTLSAAFDWIEILRP
jgi:hypothetical protein